jgi:hypothetical protein
MSTSNILDAAMVAFKQNFDDFCKKGGFNLDKTVSHHAMKKLSDALMAAAAAAGKAGLVQYLKQHDARLSSINHKQHTYRYKGTMEKTFLTLFGEIIVSRCIYGNETTGGKYLVPLDCALGLDTDDYATIETSEIILFAASTTSPGEVESLLKKVSLCHPSRTAIQNIINRDGQRIEHHQQEISQIVLNKQSIPSDATILVASLDGANVRIREPGEKKGRKVQRPVDDDKQQTNSSFRNAMVGSFSLYRPDQLQDGKPQRIYSTYIARMPEECAPTFKEAFEFDINHYAIASQNLTQPLINIILCDGHRAIWNYVDNSACLKNYLPLIDFYHTTEHLSKAAQAIFGESSPLATKWYQQWREKLLTDPSAALAIIRSIQGYMQRYKFSKSTLNELKKELTFFKRNKNIMTYAQFIEKGYPIGSGPVEAAAKTIVKQRMCRSGMRWSITGGQYILTLRAYEKSNAWESFWDAYTSIRLAA